MFARPLILTSSVMAICNHVKDDLIMKVTKYHMIVWATHISIRITPSRNQFDIIMMIKNRDVKKVDEF